MTEEIEAHIAAVTAAYRALFVGAGSRLIGGERLWSQFSDAVAAFRKHPRAQVHGVIERIYELAVARQILADNDLSTISYEPEIVASGSRFDFVAQDTGGTVLYIEVKTVAPQTEDNDPNWAKVEDRRQHITPGNNYAIKKEWMGAVVFGNSFSARSSFLSYGLETEVKLKQHNKIRQGRAVLVFCGTGFAWGLSDLEDFADYYRTGHHRLDDPFGEMERHAIERSGKYPSRTLDGFAMMLRKHDAITPEKWIYPVSGPTCA